MYSRPHPAALGPGQFQLLQNLRRDRMAARVRDGSALMHANPILASASFRGAASIELNGTSYLIAVMLDGSTKGRVFTSTDGATWTEQTASSGKFGDTRFTVDAWCYFTVAHDQYSAKDVCIIQNGTDNPRTWDPSESAGQQLSTCYEVSPPQVNNLQKTLATMRNYVTIAGSSVPTYTDSGGGLALSDNGTSPDNNMRLTADSTTAAADTATATFGSKDFQYSRQLIFLSEIQDRYYLWWEHVKVSITDGTGGTQVIWDPTAPETYTIERVEFDATTNKQLVAFPLDHITNANRTSVTAIVFTWVGPSYTGSDVHLDIYGVFCSGSERGGAQYGFTFYNRVGRCESVGMVVPVVYGATVEDLGGTKLDGAKIPLRPELYYKYRLTYQKITQTEANKGTDRILIYRAKYGETELSYLTYGTIATYAASVWSASGGAFESIVTITVDGDTNYASDPRRLIPDSLYHLPVQIGKAMHVGNGGRLFIAGKRSGGGTGRLWVSEADNPFRFRKVADTTPYSATVIDFAGEQINAIHAVSSSTYGSDLVHLFTTKSVYVLDGVSTARIGTPTRIGPIGCRSPRSIAEYKGSLAFVDEDMQVRLISGGSIQDLTRLTVDDKLQAVPATRRASISAETMYDRLYVAYTETGDTVNQRILVFHYSLGQWEADDQIPDAIDAEQLLAWWDSTVGRRRLLAFTQDGHVAEYEQPSAVDDEGETSVAIAVTPGWLHFDFDERLTVGRVGVCCTRVASGSLTVTRTYPTTNTVMTSTIDLDSGATTTLAWRWDGEQTTVTATPQAHDSACNLEIDGSMPGGSYIFGLVAETRRLDGGRGR